MSIKNKTRNTMLSNDAFEANTVSERSLGLLNPNKPRTLILKTHFGIHTFGMKTAIDILILNQQEKVVAMKKSLKSNRIFLWNPKYSTVLELPSGSIQSSQTKLGDVIHISDNT